MRRLEAIIQAVRLAGFKGALVQPRALLVLGKFWGNGFSECLDWGLSRGFRVLGLFWVTVVVKVYSW